GGGRRQVDGVLGVTRDGDDAGRLRQRGRGGDQGGLARGDPVRADPEHAGLGRRDPCVIGGAGRGGGDRGGQGVVQRVGRRGRGDDPALGVEHVEAGGHQADPRGADRDGQRPGRAGRDGQGVEVDVGRGGEVGDGQGGPGGGAAGGEAEVGQRGGG